MIAAKKDLILSALQEGTGAAMAATADFRGLRSGLRIWFADFDERHGPIAELRPHGLKGHRVELVFGNYAANVIEKIGMASEEDVQLARALVSSIRPEIEVDVPGQTLSDWKITNGGFRMTAKLRIEDDPYGDAAMVSTCQDVIVPMMAAMAELIGYDIVEESSGDPTAIFEGAVSQASVTRRERNPRNRLLCIRIHGEKCAVCGLEPRRSYGVAGSIIEVHHLEPLAQLAVPRPYDPKVDLVPLCPNCHRAAHTRRPIPFSIEELDELRAGVQ